MRYFGWAILFIGIALIVAGWSMDASADTKVIGLSVRKVVNLHQLFIKLSYIIVGGFFLPTGAVLLTFREQITTTPTPVFGYSSQPTDLHRPPGELPAKDLWQKAQSQQHANGASRWFRHRGVKVEVNKDGTALAEGQPFASADAAKEYLNTRYPNHDD